EAGGGAAVVLALGRPGVEPDLAFQAAQRKQGTTDTPNDQELLSPQPRLLVVARGEPAGVHLAGAGRRGGRGGSGHAAVLTALGALGYSDHWLVRPRPWNLAGRLSGKPTFPLDRAGKCLRKVAFPDSLSKRCARWTWASPASRKRMSFMTSCA